MRNLITLTCEWEGCDNTFQREPNQVAGAKHYFCSKACSVKAYHRRSVEAKRRAALERFARAKHHNGYYEIELRGGGTYLVDDSDVEAVKYWSWGLTKGYVTRTVVQPKHGIIYMHRVIMKRKLGRPLKPGEKVDHREGNQLDNRRSKLRLCTPLQNSGNMRKRKDGISSKYIGISWRQDCRRHWQVVIKHKGVAYHIGMFASETEAAYVRDQWALQLRGRFARLNVL